MRRLGRATGLFGLVAGLAMQAACSGSKGDTVAETSKSDDGGSDDFGVAEGVPMALFDGEYLAEVSDQVRGFASGRLSDKKVVSESPSEADGQYAVASNILSMTEQHAAEVAHLGIKLNEVLADLFGDRGKLKDEVVEIADGQTKLLRLENSDPIKALSLTAIAEPGVPKRFVLELYRKNWQANDAKLIPATTMSVQSYESGKYVTFDHIVVNESKLSFIKAAYDTRPGATYIAAAFATPGESGVAEKNAAVLQQLPDQQFGILAASQWPDGGCGVTSGFVPEYYRCARDTSFGKSLVNLGSSAKLAAQLLAFARPDELAKSGASEILKRPDDFSYHRFTEKYLSDVLRNKDINAGCATAGSTIRQAAGAGAGSTTQALPNDVCYENSALATSSLLAALSETCPAVGQVALQLKIGASPQAINVCAIWEEWILLKNPSKLFTRDGKRYILQTYLGDVETEDHKKLGDDVAKYEGPVQLPDFDQLTFAVPAGRDESDFVETFK